MHRYSIGFCIFSGRIKPRRSPLPACNVSVSWPGFSGQDKNQDFPPIAGFRQKRQQRVGINVQHLDTDGQDRRNELTDPIPVHRETRSVQRS